MPTEFDKLKAQKDAIVERDRTELEDLVRRAVRNAGPHKLIHSPRWGWVKDTFGVGSTKARKLCTIFGLDPDEVIEDRRCTECELLADDAQESGEFE